MLPGARPTETVNSNVHGFRVFCPAVAARITRKIAVDMYGDIGKQAGSLAGWPQRQRIDVHVGEVAEALLYGTPGEGHSDTDKILIVFTAVGRKPVLQRHAVGRFGEKGALAGKAAGDGLIGIESLDARARAPLRVAFGIMLHDMRAQAGIDVIQRRQPPDAGKTAPAAVKFPEMAHGKVERHIGRGRPAEQRRVQTVLLPQHPPVILLTPAAQGQLQRFVKLPAHQVAKALQMFIGPGFPFVIGRIGGKTAIESGKQRPVLPALPAPDIGVASVQCLGKGVPAVQRQRCDAMRHIF